MGAAAINYDDWAPLPQNGPLTEAEYLDLPPTPGQRIELIDGELLVYPVGDNNHQRYGSRLYRELDRVLPEDLEAIHEANVRLRPERLIIPDVVVVTGDSEAKVFPASEVLLVAEVVSPSSLAIDRIIKPQMCAEAGIPWYLRVERVPDLELLLWRRRDKTSYELHAKATEGQALEIPKLGTVEVDALRRTRR